MQPKYIADYCNNWMGWKSPSPFRVNMNLVHQDMLDLATICHKYLLDSGDTEHHAWFADVGCCIGNTSAVMALSLKQVKGRLLSMDIFADRTDWPGKQTQECWESNMKNLGLRDNILLKVKPSVEVATKEVICTPEAFGVVYIDASHIYPDIVADIKAWWPLVKKGGYLCGHDCEMNATPEQIAKIKQNPLWDKDDCTEVGHAGVIVATKELFGDKLQQKNHTWWVQK